MAWINLVKQDIANQWATAMVPNEGSNLHRNAHTTRSTPSQSIIIPMNDEYVVFFSLVHDRRLSCVVVVLMFQFPFERSTPRMYCGGSANDVLCGRYIAYLHFDVDCIEITIESYRRIHHKSGWHSAQCRFRRPYKPYELHNE